jgi:uncharacterized damage-inducible protein DinB
MNELDLLWQRHKIQHRLTVRVVEAFPEDKLFRFTPIAPMRTFAQIVGELLQLEEITVHGVATGEWKSWDQESPHAKHATKAEFVAALNTVHLTSGKLWQEITPERLDVLEASMWGGPDTSMRSRLEYMIDNEIHHRGQGYVYLRLLGIEPPGFWER